MKIKQKVLLDADVLKHLNTFYSSKLGDDILGLECFSDPKMESHICNIMIPPEGSTKCEYCGNVPGRLCRITCHIHFFCLAAYAYRIGIGELKNIKKSIHHNLSEYSYKKLYNLVMKVRDEGTDSIPIPVSEEVEDKEPEQEKEVLEQDVKLITIKDAALLYECTYANMYSFVSRGKLEKVNVDGITHVREVDVLKLKDAKQNRKKS